MDAHVPVEMITFSIIFLLETVMALAPNHTLVITSLASGIVSKNLRISARFNGTFKTNHRTMKN